MKTYQYRNLPISGATHSIDGQDRIEGGSGVLEWCTSLDDAIRRKSLMLHHKHQFVNLVIKEW